MPNIHPIPVKRWHPSGWSFVKLIMARLGTEADARNSGVEISPYGVVPRHRYLQEFDFPGGAGTALQTGLTFLDVSAAGTPTEDNDANAAGGSYTFAHDNEDELQTIGLYQGDQLTVLSTGQPIFECRVKLNFGGAALSADQRWVCGIAAAHNAVLDSNVTHAWFRIEGASLVLKVESDDGTTDTNDQATVPAITIVDDTFFSIRIDASNLSSIKFYVDEEAGDGFVLVGTTSAPLMTGNLQLYCIQQKDAGVETDAVTVDYIGAACDRG